MSHRNTTIRIPAPLMTLATLVTLTSLGMGVNRAEAAPSDKVLTALKGHGVIVHTTAGRVERGTFVHFDPKTLTLHVGDWKAITFLRRNIAKIVSSASTLEFPRGRKPPLRRPKLNVKSSLEDDLKRTNTGAANGPAYLSFGLVALAAGTVGAVFAGLRAKKVKKEAAEDDREVCPLFPSLLSDGDDDCKPRKLLNPGAGMTFLAVVSGLGAIAGIVLAAHGATLMSRASRALEKYKPQVNIDPVNKRYSVSMSLSF